MSAVPLIPPTTDPTSIFEFFRGSYGTELLTAAVVEFDLFRRLVEQPKSFEELRAEIGLQRRPAVVLFTALRAMGLLTADSQERLSLTPLSREHLVSCTEFDVSGYIALAGGSPGVREMIERLKTNRPAGASNSDEGTAFIYREGTESAMEAEASARFLTLSLAGRAKNVAPVLAASFVGRRANAAGCWRRFGHLQHRMAATASDFASDRVGPAGGVEDRSRNGRAVRCRGSTGVHHR